MVTNFKDRMLDINGNDLNLHAFVEYSLFVRVDNSTWSIDTADMEDAIDSILWNYVKELV